MPENPRIILYNSQTAPLEHWLKHAFPGAEYRECKSYATLPALIQNYRPDIVYSVRFDGTKDFPRDALFGLTGPGWIANGGARTDHLGCWDPDKTTVTNAAGVAADMMAEYAMGGLLHFTLDILGLQKDKAAKAWRDRMVRPLAGQTLLVIGLGHTGRAMAMRAKAFGMTVLGTRARPRKTEYVDEVHAASNLHALLPRADFIAISTPLIPATRGLIGADEIGAIQSGVILADVSRGGVVDQTALHAALRDGHVAGAVLDVFETEPLPATNLLWDLDNVILSPHCSAVHADWEKGSFDPFLQNLGRWMRHEDLINIVDPTRGY